MTIKHARSRRELIYTITTTVLMNANNDSSNDVLCQTGRQ